MMDLFWIVALNNIAGCLCFFLAGLVTINGKIMTQPLRDRRLGNVLVRTPNPMSTRGLDVTAVASLANGRAFGLIDSAAALRPEGSDRNEDDDDGSYQRRLVGPGQSNLTKEDDVVITNVLLFRVYGAMKIWRTGSNHRHTGLCLVCWGFVLPRSID
jgi:hypothetical protein